MKNLIAKIGKGQRGAKDLTWDEAKEAATSILENRATSFQIGAFLMAMRIKMEAVSELAAFSITTRKYVAPLQVPRTLQVVDFPTYGEKHATFHVSIAAAIVAAAGEVPVLMHGVENPSASSDVSHVLSSLGIPDGLSSNQVTDDVACLHFAYLDLALYHPSLAQLLTLRQALGVQNLFHQVARMLNPARAHSQVIGVAHPPYLEKIVEATAMVGHQRLLILQGVEGYPELSVSMPTTMRELRDGRVSPVNMKPDDVGLQTGDFRDMSSPLATSGSTASQQEALLISRILNNQIQGRQRDWVLFNAAMVLYAGRKVSSIAQGVSLAHRLLQSGAAARKLAQLSTASPLKPHRNFAKDGVPV